MAATPFDDLDAYLALPRVSGLAVSPDGARVVTTIAELNDAGTEYVTAVWELDPAGRRPARRLTRGAKGDPRRRSPPTATCCSWLAPRPTPMPTTSRRPRCGGCPPAAARPARCWHCPAASTVCTPPATRRRRPGHAHRCCRRPPTVDDDRRLRALRKDNKVSAILHTGYPVRYWDHDLGPGRAASARPSNRRGPGHHPASPVWRCARPRFDVSRRRPLRRGVVAGARRRRAALRSVLVRIDVATGERVVIADDPDADLDHPAISPDGTAVAFIRETVSTPTRRHESRCACMRFGEQPGRVAADWDRWPASVTWSERRLGADGHRR